jgi:RNA polymerase subunit RPABC4/transcription elongation factor Spt4
MPIHARIKNGGQSDDIEKVLAPCGKEGVGKKKRDRNFKEIPMADRKLCPECGASKRVTGEHQWRSDGTIVQRKNPDHRMVFIETENIAATFRGVEEIINMSIERIIVEAKRRATFDFVDHVIPGIVKTLVRIVGIKPVVRDISNLGKVMGYGNIQLVRVHRMHSEGDYATMSIEEPYSVPLFCGDLAGTFNAIDRREVGVTYKEISPRLYEVTGHISVHPLGLQERLKPRSYTRKPGDMELEKCPACGGPKALSEYQWHMDRGVIIHKERGRRMALVGPAALDAIIDDLEDELGETIPQVVSEAQRRFVKTGFYSLEEIATEELFRKELAIRGLGNLREVEWGEKSLRFRLENSCLNPVIVGLVQGFFELAFQQESRAEWEVNEEGDLVVKVSTVG